MDNLIQKNVIQSDHEAVENGAPTFTYHRFWSQVDMATAYGEYDRLLEMKKLR